VWAVPVVRAVQPLSLRERWPGVCGVIALDDMRVISEPPVQGRDFPVVGLDTPVIGLDSGEKVS